MTRELLLEQARAVTHPACKPLVNELVAELERLRGDIETLQAELRYERSACRALEPKP